jgi:hypothetical protein
MHKEVIGSLSFLPSVPGWPPSSRALRISWPLMDTWTVNTAEQDRTTRQDSMAVHHVAISQALPRVTCLSPDMMSMCSYAGVAVHYHAPTRARNADGLMRALNARDHLQLVGHGIRGGKVCFVVSPLWLLGYILYAWQHVCMHVQCCKLYQRSFYGQPGSSSVRSSAARQGASSLSTPHMVLDAAAGAAVRSLRRAILLAVHATVAPLGLCSRPPLPNGVTWGRRGGAATQ